MAPRLVIVHPSLLTYRRDFFDRVAQGYHGEMRVYFSPTDMGALSHVNATPHWAEPIGPIRSIMPGAEWQEGAVSVPLNRGDIVVISGAPRCLSNLVLLLRARLKGATIVWWGHYRTATSTPLLMTVRLTIALSAHALLFYTDAEVEEYHAQTKWPHRCPVHALNNGIDTGPIQSRRAVYAPASRERAVLFIGRLTEKTGLRTAIEALSRPAAAGISMHVIGDGAARAALIAFAEERGLADRIHWHGDTTDEDRIATVANRCRAFIYPGDVGLSLIHAMSYGLPAVLHDNPKLQMPEYAAFSDDVTGRSFPHGNSEALAQVLGRTIDDFGTLSSFSTKALDKTETDYTTRGMATRMLALIEKLEAVR